MTRITVTSDIHFGITKPDAVDALIKDISAMRPDAVAVAGDVGEPLQNFAAALDALRQLDVPVAIVLGNHDIWNRNRQIPSRELWEVRLPEEIMKRGFAYLERETILIDDIAVAGSIAWYDYSAASISNPCEIEEFARRKGEFCGDALFVDWPWDDLQFCRKIEGPFAERLNAAQRDRDVKSILVVTHSPIFDEQIARKPGNERWSFSNAYYGNITFGESVRKFGKVRHVVSGHSHAGRQGVVNGDFGEIIVTTLDSQYGKPVFMTVEL
jgi:predicted MPP superfamily phosphohydrolase